MNSEVILQHQSATVSLEDDAVADGGKQIVEVELVFVVAQISAMLPPKLHQSLSKPEGMDVKVVSHDGQEECIVFVLYHFRVKPRNMHMRVMTLTCSGGSPSHTVPSVSSDPAATLQSSEPPGRSPPASTLVPQRSKCSLTSHGDHPITH